MKYFPLFQVFVFFTKIRIFWMCSYISHMLNHFRCEPLKNVFCFVRNRLMLDDAMNSVYSGKRYLFQLACLCVMFLFLFLFFGTSMSASVLLSSAVVSHMFLLVFFFLANQNSSSRTATACWYFIGWKKVRKPTENPNCVDVLIVCLNYV